VQRLKILCFDLHPSSKKIYAITDGTTTGKRIRAELELVKSTFEQKGIRIDVSKDLPMRELKEEVNRLPSDYIVYYTLFFRDRTGSFYEYDESIRLISENCAVPIYGAWDFSLGYGIIGGLLTSGYDQGETAAKMALRILNGESVENNPVVKKSPNRYKFDYVQLERHGINASALPEGAIIINSPTGLYDNYKTLIWEVIIAFGILSFVIVVLIINIVRRKKAESEVAVAKNYLHEVIDSMPSILMGVDESGIITNFNSEARSLTPGSECSLVGKSIIDVIPEFSEYTATLADAIGDGEPRDYKKVKIGRANGDNYYNITIYPLKGQSLNEVVVRIDDVTENARLQDLMVQTEKLMSVGGLAAGMAHEINNPLGAIIQGAQNIVRRTSPDLIRNCEIAEEMGISVDIIQKYLEERKVYQFLDGIQASGKKAARIIADMLKFSRKSESNKIPVSLAEVIENAINLGCSDYDMKKRFDFKFIKINREYDEDASVVKCFPSEIEQVVLNLLKNAVQAMNEIYEDDYTPELWVRVAQDGNCVRLEVEDNGPGVPENVKNRIFEPFFTTKPVGSGTGLGLSVSYMIITQNHKGLFDVESTEGLGSKFTIKLPVLP